MRCPVCLDDSLVEILTERSVLIDRCNRCDGIWLDRGEVFLFSRDPKRLEQRLASGSTMLRPTDRICPRCQVAI